MRQLKPEIEIAVGVRAEPGAMRGHELVAQRGQRWLGLFRDEQLIRIGTAVVADSDGFAAPNQLGAARTEALPAAARQLARLARGRAVPAFHWQHAEAVADADRAVNERLRERRLGRRDQRIVKAEIDARRAQMPPEKVRRLERRDADIPRVAHAWRSRGPCSTVPSRCAMYAASAPRLCSRIVCSSAGISCPCICAS